MMPCLYLKDGDEFYRCRHCGHVTQTPIFRECTCPPEPRQAPAPLVRAINFAKAVFSQVALSAESLFSDEEIKLTRSPEEIKEIAAICKACPLFDGKVCTHGDCGCPIDEDRAVWWSKIAWKSQHCPDNPPKW